MDGPITENNPMGVHHAWGRTYKDIYQRYKTMQGYRQSYQNGFDSQGLWVEVEVEKELGFKTKLDIEAFGIAEFVQRCKERVFTFARRMIEQSIRLGYWMNWGNDYYTLSDENNYTIWSFLKRCYERGLVYKGHDGVTWCPRCATGISDMETLSEDYQDTSHLSRYVRLPLVYLPVEYLLVGTTTPGQLGADFAVSGRPHRPAAELGQAMGESLAQKGLHYRPENYKHRYPVCWRCKTELIFRLVDEWYISMDQLRYQIMDVAREATWIPAFGLERELDWLRNMDDWMISKKRYWGLALPIYDCQECGTFEVIGSEHELKERAVAGWEELEGHSPHRPWVDGVKIKCQQCGNEVSRIKDVGNPWLDAGIVPFSTLHYRTNRKHWEQWFPADFVTESFPGQFKNWFYSLLVMSTVLEDTTPFKTLFGYGTLMGEDGTPMHKSKGNLVIFDEPAERVGSDTMRWLFATHVPEQNLNFPRIPTDEDIEKSAETGLPMRLSEKWMLVRRTMDKLWNVYGFFVTYANIDAFDPMQYQLPVAERIELDRWILSELQQTI